MGQGAGGESRRPLSFCVVGGLLFSQLITLYLTPVVYIYVAKVQAKISRPKITPASQEKGPSPLPEIRIESAMSIPLHLYLNPERGRSLSLVADTRETDR